MSEERTCQATLFDWKGYGFPCGRSAKYEGNGKHYCCKYHDPIVISTKREIAMDQNGSRRRQGEEAVRLGMLQADAMLRARGQS